MIYILGVDLFDCMKNIYKGYIENKENKNEFMSCDFNTLTIEFNTYIGEEFECYEVKDKAVELAKLGFIYLFVDVLDGNEFFFRVSL